ncbi:MAG: hypothetical protein ACR2HK_09045 [Gemmatimonadales bacterium]
MSVPPPGAPLVVKVGGGLTAIPGALDRVGTAVCTLGQSRRVVVVPGGGPFADAVRAYDARFQVSADAAHWMAILAMDQYAQVLAERIAGATLIEGPGEVAAVAPGAVAVLAPYRWMRAADVLPHTWNATSDSVAAFVAGALGSRHLVLVKPCEEGENLVDHCFAAVLPAGLSCTTIAWDRIEELADRLASGAR